MPVLGRIELAERAGSGPPWKVVAEVAAVQHGIVGRWQLLELGFRAGAIQRAVGRGLLHPVHHGVYAVGHGSLTTDARLIAAVIACGEGAMLSHRSAAARLGILDTQPHRVDVIATRCGRGPRDGIVIHRPRRLPTNERWMRAGIPLTNGSRTLIDLASVLAKRELEEAVHAADRRRILDIARIDLLVRRSPGRRGSRNLLAVLATYRPLPRTRSWLQDRFLLESDRAGIPRPAVDVVVEGMEVDCYWPDERLIVELDSYGFHGDPDSFENDRRRDVALRLAGYTVLRFTHRRVTSEPTAVVAEASAALASARRTRWAGSVPLSGPDPAQ